MNLFNLSGSKPQKFTSDYKALIQQFEAVVEINNAMIGVLKRDEILDLVTKKLLSVLGVSFADILVWDDKERSLSVVNVSAPKAAILLTEKTLGKPFSSIKFYADKDKDNGYIQTMLSGEIVETHDLASLSQPLLNAGISNIVQTLLNMQLAVSVPLYVREQKLGVLGLIWKKDSLTDEDRALIKTFSTQISNTLYNSFLFNKIQSQVTELETKNRDLSSLFNLASRVGQSLDPKTVAQTAVDSLPQDQDMMGAVIAEYDRKSGESKVKAVSRNPISDQVENLMGGFDKFPMQVNDPKFANNSTIKAILTNTPQFSEDITADFSPPMPQALVPAIQRLINISMMAVYPLTTRAGIVGTITYIFRNKKLADIDDNQRQLLSTYTLQIAIAMENANLYARSQTIQQNLQDALYQLKEIRRQERDMVDIMGHELRTPLSIVRNGLVMVKKQYEIDHHNEDQISKYLEMSLESTRREITLVETLLSATKVDAARIQLYFTKVDLDDVVGDSIEAQKNNLQQRHLIATVDNRAKGTFVYADRTRIQEIVDNLYSNAVKYTNKGEIKITMWKDDKFAWVSVKDSGIGISEEDMKNLGKKFFRAKQYITNSVGEKGEIVRPGGTGLGLYIIFDLIKLMGGNLYINSKVGEGSSFTFSVPLHTGQEDKQVDQTFDRSADGDRSHVYLNQEVPGMPK